MKYILVERATATRLMQRIIINVATTSLWFDPWIDHKSMVDWEGTKLHCVQTSMQQ